MTLPTLDRQGLMTLLGGYRSACILGAAAELDIWTLLGTRSQTASEITDQCRADRRAMTMLLDALAAIGALDKRDGRYSTPDALRDLLSADSPGTFLPMIQHHMCVLRGWSQLAYAARSGVPAPRLPSIRGPMADRAAFIAAMHSVSGPMADELLGRLGDWPMEHLVDVGGASGTWTMAWLRIRPQARATIFDLPDAIEQARQRIGRSEFAERVSFAAGDFYRDELPADVDFAWVSAIVHQHSRGDNRDLFAKVHRALRPGGRIALRDVVMDPERTTPVEGALFAINMLANTDTGGTFTFEELSDDLIASGFVAPELVVRDQWMNSVVTANRP
jgi:SAM-dependent methyltransferase